MLENDDHRHCVEFAILQEQSLPILFGCRIGALLWDKRRAYQRKVAVAEFDAVVSLTLLSDVFDRIAKRHL